MRRVLLSLLQSEPVLYRLRAVVVHTGDDVNCGHYTTYVKASTRSWYLMDDAVVSIVMSRLLFFLFLKIMFLLTISCFVDKELCCYFSDNNCHSCWNITFILEKLILKNIDFYYVIVSESFKGKTQYSTLQNCTFL